MDSNVPAVPHTAEAIQNWIVAWLSRELTISADEIDPAQTFEHFGASSLTVVAMTGDMDEWLGHDVDPAVVYDYPTIAGLAHHLAPA